MMQVNVVHHGCGSLSLYICKAHRGTLIFSICKFAKRHVMIELALL